MDRPQRRRVALITGVTGGLGAAVARAFAEEGASVVLAARRREELEMLAATLRLPPDRTLIAPADLTSPEAVEQVMQSAVERFDAIDVVAHLAGGFKGGAPAAETDVQTWQFLLNLNMTTAFLVARAALPGMLRRGAGKLVLVGSRDGTMPSAGFAAYGASKGGLEALVRALAEEARPRGVNVNAVAPSIIDTPANRRANPAADYSAWVTPESLAGVIHFLASDAARDVHGAVVPVYGRA